MLHPKKRFPLLIIAILLIGAGAAWYWEQQKPVAADTLVLSGSIEARQVHPGFLVAGRIARLQVDEGVTVEPGQPLADLDPRDFQLALLAAEAQRDAAAATLAALEAGSRKEDVEAGKAAVDAAQARLHLAEVEAARLRDLVPRKLASQEQLDRAVADKQAARAERNQAKARLKLLQAGPRQEDIDRARAELAAREAAVKIARQKLDYTQLTSPVSGMISARLIEAGDVVGVGKPVFEIDAMQHPWIRAYLNEPDLPRVRLGQQVRIDADGLDGQTLSGTLSFISPRAEFTPKTVETHALRVDLVYRIKVDVDNPDGLLKLGMPVDLTLDTQ